MCRVAAVEKAEAEKIQVVKAAEGDAESKYLAGQVSCFSAMFLGLDLSSLTQAFAGGYLLRHWLCIAPAFAADVKACISVCYYVLQLLPACSGLLPACSGRSVK